jgi:hypothetical protein
MSIILGNDILPGELIVFEGPDNCGKSTQLKLVGKELKQRLREKYDTDVNIYYFKFPQRGKLYGDMIYYMLLHKENYNFLYDEDRKLFSQLQYNDKLDGLQHLHQLLSQDNTIVLLDRFTLSARIYDAVNEYIHNYKICIPYTKVSNGIYVDGKYEAIFSEASMHFFKDIFKDIFLAPKNTYEILEHNLFNTFHVIFRSCDAISQIVEETRKLDQYEDNSLFKEVVNSIYNNITYYEEFYKDFIQQKHLHSCTTICPYIQKGKYTMVDTTELIFKQMQNASGTKKYTTQDMYEFMKNYRPVSSITSDITDKIIAYLNKN